VNLTDRTLIKTTLGVAVAVLVPHARVADVGVLVGE